MRDLPLELWGELGFAFAELTEAGAIRHAQPAPGWLGALLPEGDSLEEVLFADGSSSFLCAFLSQHAGDWPGEGDRPVASGPWEEAIAGGDEGFEAKLMRRNGRRLVLVERLGERYDQYAQVLRLARRHRLDQERIARDVELRDVLIHCIVHDLNSPATAVSGALALLDPDELPESAKALIDIARRGARNQTQLIGDILDVLGATGEARFGLGDGDSGRADVEAVGRQVVEELAPVGAQYGVELRWGGDADESWPPIDGVAVGEESRLRRVFTNLTENAIRCSGAGTAVVVGIDKDADSVTGWVDDAGPGVDPELSERIFDRFRSSRDRRKRGKAGLGLYFCRITVERWGGAIGYQDREGGGTRFWFRLPRPN
jgi:signal transduction histidine kinase